MKALQTELSGIATITGGLTKYLGSLSRSVVEMIIPENNVALGMLMQRTLDLSNYFIPGIPAIKNSFGLNTWFDDAPYMLQANTAVLYLNNQRPPMDDKVFRRALAHAVNPEVIVERVFEFMVPASDPTGLFGGWMAYHDPDVAREYGFSYNPEYAAQLLDEAGYVDQDGDGWRDLPDGTPMSFEIIVPAGWTDWMESIRIISDHFRAIGVNANPAFPDQSVYENRMFTGNFDMLINNYGATVSGSPFTYWNWIANHNIHREQVTEGNFGRYDNPELFDLILEFNKVLPMTEESLAIASEIRGSCWKICRQSPSGRTECGQRLNLSGGPTGQVSTTPTDIPPPGAATGKWAA